jgi:hypothetical protein
MPLVARDFLKKVSTRKFPRLVNSSERLDVSAGESQFKIVDTKFNLSSKPKLNLRKESIQNMIKISKSNIVDDYQFIPIGLPKANMTDGFKKKILKAVKPVMPDLSSLNKSSSICLN